MTATIDHSAEGTLVHGTTRDDTVTIEVLKANGFRWSRNLGAWYLPRNLRHETRDQRVRNVKKALGDGVDVEIPDGGRRQSAAERENARKERAEGRAERKTAQAEKLQAQSDALHREATDAADRIPFGQPILVGHHSENRDRRERARIHRKFEKSFETQAAADRAQAAADRATRTAAGTASIVTIDNRIQRNEAELRRVDRLLAGSASPGQGPATGEYADQLRERREELVDQIGFDKDKLAAAGGITYGKHNVSPGDLINAAGRWLPVVRANARTVTVPSGYSWTDTVPWSKVRSVTKAEDFSPDQAAQLLEGAGDDQYRRAALEKTLVRAEQAAAKHPVPSPGAADDALSLDIPTTGETNRAEQRLHRQPQQETHTVGRTPSTTHRQGR